MHKCMHARTCGMCNNAYDGFVIRVTIILVVQAWTLTSAYGN